MGENVGRVVFLDYLRVFACFAVMVIHACEQFYFGPDGGLLLTDRATAAWTVWIDSACRAAVPLFVMASSYLLFPVERPTGDFFRRRLVRVFVPFALWCCVYTLRFDGSWLAMAFNFPMATGGHLWFVPMLLGLYLVMPLLSPWAERVTERELRGWLAVWLFTTTFPFLRTLARALFGEPSFGAIPFLYGECPWNGFGAFHYLSGFVGYLLLGLWFRKFTFARDWSATLRAALPLWAAGVALVGAFFWCRIPDAGGYPVRAPYAKVVDLEASWEFCSFGVALTVAAYFLVLRKLTRTGSFYRRVVRPLAEASYGTYLVHILVLVEVAEILKPKLAAPLAIVAIAVVTFLVSSLASILLRRIPRIGRGVIFLGDIQ